VLQELLTLGALVLFLLWFPRLLLRTWATGHYAGIGVTLKPRRPRVGPGPVASTVLAVFRLARFVMQRVFAPAVAAGGRQLVRLAAHRPGHAPRTPWLQEWRQWWPRSPTSAQPTTTGSEPTSESDPFGYPPDEFDDLWRNR
jgi:hypothetical protein